MRLLRQLIRKTADRMTCIGTDGFSETCPISIIDIQKWEWAQGVGLYGLYRGFEATGDQNYLTFLLEWYDSRLKEGLPPRNINTTAPMLTLTFLYEITKKPNYLALIEDWADTVMNHMRRTPEGGLCHVVSGSQNEGQLWVDTLFMTVLFLARAGVLLNRPDYIEETKRQFLVHIKYLYDKTTGLWFHGWSFFRNDNFAGALWGRGNCWYTAGVVDYIDILGLEDGGLKAYLLDTFTAQAKALKRFQAPNGMWHTLLNDPSSYLETSATAGFCYGLLKGIRKGYLDQSFAAPAQAALQAVISRILPDGTVSDVSYGTGLSDNLEYYKTIKKCPMTYGQALALLCMSEALLGGKQ